MYKEKNLTNKQSVSFDIGAANSQSAAEQTQICSECVTKEIFTSFKLSRELRIKIIKAELLIMERYNSNSKGMNKEISKQVFDYYIDKTPYRKLKVNGNPSCSLILRATASCLYLCYEVKKDDMHKLFFVRNICQCEHAFEKAGNVDDFRVELSQSISGFTETHYEYLKKLYPNAKNNAELAKLAISDVLMIAARLNGKFDTHLSSAGSKKSAMKCFHFDRLKFIDGDDRVLVDVFSRTASVALASMGAFDNIYCGDKDKSFVNFFEVLRDYPVALVLRLKSICADLNSIEGAYKDIKNRVDKALHKASHSVRIDAAACLLIKFRCSFSGYGKDFNSEQAEKFIKGLDAVCNDLLYTSMVLTDRKKSRKLYKGIYKKSADGLAYKLVDELSEKTISVCPITYEHWGFMKPILENKDNPNAVIVLDCPYLRQFLLSCGDYKSEFGMEHLRQIFRTLKNAKCKVVLFNYKNLDYESLAEEYGFRLAGTYGANGGKSTEETLVYSLNITPDEKFFDPPKNSENSN